MPIGYSHRLQTRFSKHWKNRPRILCCCLLSALPEALPETILSRCIAIPLARDGQLQASDEEKKLVKLLQQISHEQSWTIQFAYRLCSGISAFAPLGS